MRIFVKQRMLLAGLGLIVVFGGGAAHASIAKLDQTITVVFHAPATATYGNAFAVAATSTSGLPVTFSSSGACSNSAPGSR
jgi:hypothetical protein